MNEKRNVTLRDALLRALAVATFTAVSATAFTPVAQARVLLDDVNDDVVLLEVFQDVGGCVGSDAEYDLAGEAGGAEAAHESPVVSHAESGGQGQHCRVFGLPWGSSSSSSIGSNGGRED